MNGISLPYHLVIPTLVSLLFIILIVWNRRRLLKNENWKWFWISTIVFFGIYMLIVGAAAFSDLYAQWNVNRYDLNQDGLFTGDELTPEQEAAINHLIADTGRNFSIITGLIFAGVIAALVFVIGNVTEYMIAQKNSV